MTTDRGTDGQEQDHAAKRGTKNSINDGYASKEVASQQGEESGAGNSASYQDGINQDIQAHSQEVMRIRPRLSGSLIVFDSIYGEIVIKTEVKKRDTCQQQQSQDGIISDEG